MKNVAAADVIKLRKIIGSGIMDTKKALIEAEGNFEKAIEILRRKGKKIAFNRLEKQSCEGVIVAKVNTNFSKGVIISLNCETDFVAKNKNFIQLAHSLAELALQHNTKESLLKDQFKGIKVRDNLIQETGIIGEKIEINEFRKITAPAVGFYIHTGNKIASIVGLSKKIENFQQIGKEIAMQVTAMNPIAINESNIDSNIIKKELDIERDLLLKEGKSLNMIENIIKGKLNKFYKENTLINQKFINNEKLSVKQYLNLISKDLEIVSFDRVSLL